MTASTPSSPTPPPAPVVEEEIVERRTLRDYLIILRERMWIALPVALLLALGVAYFQARVTPLYRATASLKIERPNRVVTSQEIVDTAVTSDIELNTYLQVIASDKVRNKVLASLSPEERTLVQRAYLARTKAGETPPPVGACLGQPFIQSIRNSFVISISIDHPDAQAAALLANRYVREFIQVLFENVGGKNDYAVEFLQKRAAELLKESTDKEQALQKYMREQNLVSLDASTNIVQARLTAVNAALQNARLERIAIEEQFTLVDRYRAEGKNLLEITAIGTYGTVPDLRKQLENLERDHALLVERYFERHPKTINAANAIAVVRQQLDEAIALGVADLKTSLERARSAEKTLEREYTDQEREQMRLRDLSIEYRALVDQVVSAKTSYTAILDRLSQATTSRYLENIPVSPLDPATPPSRPFLPSLGTIAQISIGVFFLSFIGVAIGLTYFDDRIKSAWDIETFLGTHLLGIVPDLAGVNDEEKYRLTLDTESTPSVEPLLGIYTAVKSTSSLGFPKTILVTSTIPGEGKTLVSSNLAGAFVRHGKRVLIMDGDLRRPMLHKHFDKPNEPGLLTWFASGGRADGDLLSRPELGITHVGKGLYLLSSGGRTKSPTPLLESEQFTALIAQLKKQFDLIVIDSPPLGAVTDALLIAERADEVIYVCRFNKANRRHVRLYLKALRTGKNIILGIVLNGLSPRRIEYYSNQRYYRSYKKYYGGEG